MHFLHKFCSRDETSHVSIGLLSPAHTQRLLKLQSILRRAPSYRTLELQLIEWQERELFEYFVVVSLKKKPSKNSYSPEVTYQFPKVNAAKWQFTWRTLRFFIYLIVISGSNQVVVEIAGKRMYIKKCLLCNDFNEYCDIVFGNVVGITL